MDIVDIFDTMAKMSTDDEKQDFLKTLKEKDFDFLEDYLNFKPLRACGRYLLNLLRLSLFQCFLPIPLNLAELLSS